MDFPQYRKLSEFVYYRITSDRSFDEIRLVGSKAFFHTINAVQYPEILRIREMLDFQMEHLLSSNETEFNSILKAHGL